MKDRLFAGVSLATAVGYYALASRIQASDLSDGTGPAGLPLTYAVLLGALALVLLAQSAFPLRRTRASTAPAVDGTTWSWRPLATLGAGIGYVAFVPALGYVPAITALITAATLTNGGRLTPRTVAVALGGAFALWALFVWFLGIEQPQGLWPFPPSPGGTP